MKVREIIDKLKVLDPELEVVGYTEDEDLLVAGHLFRIFLVESISVCEAEMTHTEDGLPTFRIGKTQSSKQHLVLNMTGTF